MFVLIKLFGFIVKLILDLSVRNPWGAVALDLMRQQRKPATHPHTEWLYTKELPILVGDKKYTLRAYFVKESSASQLRCSELRLILAGSMWDETFDSFQELMHLYRNQVISVAPKGV